MMSSVKWRRSAKISVIIPNWNGKNLLKICLPSLKKQEFAKFEVIIIDNGSHDGSSEYIKKYFPEFRVIELKQNTGFAAAVNLGIKICVGENIVLLNNDTKVTPNFLSSLFKASFKKDIGMVAAKIMKFYERDKMDSAGAYIDIVGHANNLGIGQQGEKFNRSGYVFLVSGGGCLIKRIVLEKVGFFDEKYFAYMEDVDFSLRAQMQGFKAWYEPKALIYHIHKATSSKNPAFLEYLQFRNMMQTIIKDFPQELLVKNLNWLKIFLVNVHTFYYLSKKGYFKSALKAEVFIIANILRLLHERKLIQSSIKVDKQYLIDNFTDKKITFYRFLKVGF